MLSKMYWQGLHWILAGDFNELKTDKILEISPNLRQVVTLPTRYNPPSILDKIITTLHKYYQVPQIKPPLDNDPDKTGKPSDHTFVEMTPISVVNNKPARETKVITHRPITDAGLHKMQVWLKQTEWKDMTQGNVHESAKEIMDLLKQKTEDFFPTKARKISSDNQPFFTEHLSKLKRRKQREYSKHRKSQKWIKMNIEYENKLNTAKKAYYKNEIAKLKNSDPKRWFYWLKRLVSSGQTNEREINVNEIEHLPYEEQAEQIADSFAKISQEYDQFKSEDISIPFFCTTDIPVISVNTVETYLSQIKISKSVTKDDIPAQIVKKFSNELSEPITALINACIQKEHGLMFLNVKLSHLCPKCFLQSLSKI